MKKETIFQIRILPNDKQTFKTEKEFRTFIEDTMITRNGKYYFPNQMMKCPKNTLVLFQYRGMIRALGVLIDYKKKMMIDERGVEYAGYYQFDIESLKYLRQPIDKISMKNIYDHFNNFNQSKQIVPLEYLDDILDLIANTNNIILDDDSTIINEIENTSLDGSEKEALVKIRINQGMFRNKLLRRYNKCCLCGVNDPNLLIASHIKPWAVSKPNEKLDVNNGLLLCPNHDSLFDKGLISFDEEGKILISDNLKSINRLFMNVDRSMKIELTEDNKMYLKYHREEVFQS